MIARELLTSRIDKDAYRSALMAMAEEALPR
jgi:hypothetical protein